MTDKTNTEKPLPAVFKKDSTEVTLGGTTFEVASGSSDVNVYEAGKLRSKAPSRRAPKNVTNQSITPNDERTGAQVFGATLEASENETPLIVTTGVIRPKRGPAPVIKVPVKAAPKDNKASPVLAEILPAKTRFEVGEETVDGWICVSKVSRLARAFLGAKPVKVIKFVGDVTYQDLSDAAKAEELKKTVADIHVPNEGEVRDVFNTVATIAEKAQGVWIDTPATSINVDATAVSLAAQDKRQPLRTPKTGGHKNAGVLFGTLKLAKAG